MSDEDFRAMIMDQLRAAGEELSLATTERVLRELTESGVLWSGPERKYLREWLDHSITHGIQAMRGLDEGNRPVVDASTLRWETAGAADALVAKRSIRCHVPRRFRLRPRAGCVAR
jgi:hypothetical protein